MTIEEVIRESIVALFSTTILENTLVLKGGSALILVEGLTSRFSTDIDFSAVDKISNPDNYFSEVTAALTKTFLGHGYDVIDGNYSHRPKTPSAETPNFWGGYIYQFKLSPISDRPQSLQIRRIKALKPAGSESPTIDIEISEHEYTGSLQQVLIGGVAVKSYSNYLLILEKMRAICQQHDSYKPVVHKRPRGRDFYDIYQLWKKHRANPELVTNLSRHIGEVFAAKDVSLTLLDSLSDENFMDFFRSNFNLNLSASGEIQPFDFYLENLKLLVIEIKNKLPDQ